MTDKTVKGFVAGVTSTVLTHPLDTLKVYQQVTSRSSNGGVLNSIKTISNQGLIKGFYRGGFINCASMGVFYSCFFPTYDLLKNQFNSPDELPGRFWSGYLAGLWGSFVGNPFYVLKIRQQASIASIGQSQIQPSIPELTRKIYAERGIRGFWSGYNLTIIRNLELGLQLPLYETFKDHGISPIYAGFMAKLISSSATYPIDTCRTLIRNGNGNNVLPIASCLLQSEGIRGLYRGYLFSAIKSVPASAITFTVYELFRRFE